MDFKGSVITSSEMQTAFRERMLKGAQWWLMKGPGRFGLKRLLVTRPDDINKLEDKLSSIVGSGVASRAEFEIAIESYCSAVTVWGMKVVNEIIQIFGTKDLDRLKGKVLDLRKAEDREENKKEENPEVTN